ncbi:MAG: peptidoglycan DD-metalloendopeptidase family protein [Actinomyces bowdenii]|nr:peptidoglycan DD-metalloendopeptidase family protein [Actinomyces bowdenii]
MPAVSAPSSFPAPSGSAVPTVHEAPEGAPSAQARPSRRSRRARGSRAALDASLDAALLAHSSGSAATPAAQAPQGAASPGPSATGSATEPAALRAGRARILGAGSPAGPRPAAESHHGESQGTVPHHVGRGDAGTVDAGRPDAQKAEADRSWDSAGVAGAALSWKPIASATAGTPAGQQDRGPQAQAAPARAQGRTQAQGPSGGAGLRADEAAPKAGGAQQATAGRPSAEAAGAARRGGAATMAAVSGPQREADRRAAASSSPAEVAAGAAEAASTGGRELRFSRELEEFRSADTLQVPELRRMSRKVRRRAQDDHAQEGADTVRGESFGLSGAGSRPARGSRRPTPARPSPGRRSASVLGRTAVLVTLAVATVIAPVSGQLTNAALASTGGFSQSLNEASPQASSRPSSVAAAVLGSDADLDEEGGEDLSNVPDAATLARIREAYQNAAKTCSSVTGASGDTSAFNSAPELFYPMLPDTYTISSEYGYRIHPTLGYLKLHAGQDLSAPVGTAIYAVAAGTVTTAGMVDGTGTVTIKHEVDGKVWYTSYLHMYEDGIYVKAGDTVTAGQLIAGVGNTGRSSGPHLHFEVRTADDTADESTVEPWGWLKEHNAVELTTNCS